MLAQAVLGNFGAPGAPHVQLRLLNAQRLHPPAGSRLDACSHRPAEWKLDLPAIPVLVSVPHGPGKDSCTER